MHWKRKCILGSEVQSSVRRPPGPMVLLHFSVSLPTFCLKDPFTEGGALKSHVIMSLLSVSHFRSVNICFFYFGDLM